MKLYQNYCYETIDEVADLIASDPFALDYTFIESTQVIDLNTIEVNLNSFPSYTFIPPSCTKIGFQSSYTGLTMSDSIEISSIFTLALVTVWGIKILRRGL